MRAAGVPKVLALASWFFVQPGSGIFAPKYDCGDDVRCEGARNMLCARNLTGTADYARWWAFEACMYADQPHIPQNAPRCANETGVPAGALAACVGGALGQALLAESMAQSKAAGVGWTPYILINHKLFTPVEDYLTPVCEAFEVLNPGVPPPAGCSNASLALQPALLGGRDRERRVEAGGARGSRRGKWNRLSIAQ